MNKVQRENPQLFYGVSNNIMCNDVKVRSINDNKMWVGKSMSRTSPSYNYEPPTRIEQRNGNGRSMERVRSNYNKSTPNTSWWNDNDMKRKRRVAKYKVYSSESKLKCSLKKGFRSLKNKGPYALVLTQPLPLDVISLLECLGGMPKTDFTPTF